MENQWSRSNWPMSALHPDTRQILFGFKWSLMSSLMLPNVLLLLSLPSYAADCFAGQGALPEVPQWTQTLWREGVQIHTFGKTLTSAEDVEKIDLSWTSRHVDTFSARWETNGGDAVSGSTLWHQSRHQHPDPPCGPISWLQPRQPYRDPHWGWDQRPIGAACTGCPSEFICHCNPVW